MDKKSLIIDYGIEMLKEGLVKANWGNISIRSSEGVWITPSGMDYHALKEADLVLVDLEGQILAGQRRPSSELLMHLEIYKKYPAINAVIHTHSIYASAFAVSRKEIPPIIEDMVQIAGGNIKLADYALPGTQELALKVAEALEGRNACLMANHGLTGMGKDMEEAFKVCLIVEKAAQIALAAYSLGNLHLLSDEDVAYMREAYLTSYGQK